jgi:hypothetical protein
MDLGHGNRWRLAPCPVCPAQTLPVDGFDVSERPGPATRYDPTAGHPINTTTGRPECIHPSRVHRSADRYTGTGEPASTTPRHQPPNSCLRPPESVAELEAWFSAALRDIPTGSRAAALANAEASANQRFPTREVTAAMRRALAHELTRGILIRRQPHV